MEGLDTRFSRFQESLKRVQDGRGYTLEDIVTLLKAEGEDSEALFAAAFKVREQEFGKEVYLRGIIEFSNYCSKNCLYCGIRAENSIHRYRMTIDEITAAAQDIKNAGIGTVVLQSGEDAWWSPERIMSLIKSIKEQVGITITLSIGERSREEYALYREAGVERFLLKIETTSKDIFTRMHPDDCLFQRKKCSVWLKELGYMNGSGCIIGLPGQCERDLAADILWFRDMGMDMIGVGPFVPAQNTPLENHPPGSTFMTIKTVAVIRLICRKAFLPATTALETLEEKGQLKALKAGANVIMLNYTPQTYKSNYKIYSNKKAIKLEKALETIEQAGLARVIDSNQNNQRDGSAV
ncbi:[FeFe] hydrogenase H-cluster radical SAM maturase HydE [Desulfitibacter alkalitolerans]|jgi:biotin synthase|uniref:[FeFe] hydrogenase H-cluster radical SAM maturase HydE n=1 Tax=Desulfitibacter alkalitolerans TaxID=264641 RepID=UPI000687F766|nr:[FeFe] hydrogenase H-cluster radical SAM maturase HydE [Desulfitibacter alkalitolerans]